MQLQAWTVPIESNSLGHTGQCESVIAAHVSDVYDAARLKLRKWY